MNCTTFPERQLLPPDQLQATFSRSYNFERELGGNGEISSVFVGKAA